MDKSIERVDTLPLILHWLDKMHVADLIDALWQPHGNWEGLSYGQVAVLFLAFVLYTHTHRLSYVEDWSVEHRHTLERATGWRLRDKELTDDRLGRLLEELGSDPGRAAQYQQLQGQHLIRAYALPTEVARYDTTTFSVYHDEDEREEPLLTFGHSKDRRPDLRQYKQGLATLDPAGVPLMTLTVPGKQADDDLYVPAWYAVRDTLGHSDFLYVTDSKGSATVIRATIAAEGGYYLCPLALKGRVPDQLAAWVTAPPSALEPIYREPASPDEPPLGQGFVVVQELTKQLAENQEHSWSERWLVMRSTAHAEREQHALKQRLTKTKARLRRMRAKKDETCAAFQARAQHLIDQQDLTDILHVTVTEQITQQKRYLRPGRPTADTPFEIREQRTCHLQYRQDAAALELRLRVAGWRIYVTNMPAEQLSLQRATTYYRGQWTNERAYHRFKRGSLPAVPLFLRIPERISGLMLLLMVALQALTLIEYVARETLQQQEETLAGLVPGNPAMRTARPTAERILTQFHNLHLLILTSATEVRCELVERLSPLQQKLLDILHVPRSVYDFDSRVSCV
jgi:transposase